MCGICGYVRLKEKRGPSVPDLKGMNETLVHRGPDGDGYFEDEGIGLANRRLSVIDPEGGWQPLYNETRTIVSVFNGEIYNHGDLRKDLLKQGHRFRTRVDTEIIPHQYEMDGDRCVEKFNGMFAFALWDGKAKRLVLARDRLGIKPLYWALDRDWLLFGSEIKAVMAGMARKPEIDPEKLHALMRFQYIPGRATPFRGIHRLAPGHLLVVEKGALKEIPYWALPSPENLEGRTKENLQEEFLALLEDSVKLRLISDVPLGVFLSGGIDSTVIVALMKKLVGQEAISTFSVDFEGGKNLNETRFAEHVSRTFGTRHHRLTVTPGDLDALLCALPARLDDPITDPAVIPTYMVSSLARDRVTVVLSGEGADEIFGGYLRYSLGDLMERTNGRLIRSAARLGNMLLSPFPLTLRIEKALRAASTGEEAVRHLELVSVFSGKTLSSFFSTLSPAGTEEKEFFNALFRNSPYRGINRVMKADLVSWLPDDLLAKVDRMSMAVSLEARVPYLDHRLVSFAMGLPSPWKVKNLKRKIFFKEAVRELVPDLIIRRPKRGFDLPLKEWFRGALRPQVEEILAEDRIKETGILHAKEVNLLVRRHMEGFDDHSLQLWSLLVLQKWLEYYQ